MKAAKGRLQNTKGEVLGCRGESTKKKCVHPMTRVTLDIEHSTQQGALLKINAAEGRFFQNDSGHIRWQE